MLSVCLSHLYGHWTSFAVAAGISLSKFILEPLYSTEFSSKYLRTSSLAKLQKQWYHSHLLGYHWLISSNWNSFCSESIFSLTCRVIITFPLSFLWRFYDLVCTPTFNFCIHVDSSHLTHEAFFFFEWNNIRVWAYLYHCTYMAD